jgi:3-oxo-5-alpha-steroid 4-dehydrogenase 1
MTGQIIYKILLCTVFATALIVFISLFITSAPYGRHSRRGWGLTINARLSWLIMESPSFFTMILMFIIGGRKTNLIAILFLSIWTAHYFHRTFIYPFLMRGGNKKFPLLLMIFAIFFNTANGFINGYYLFIYSPAYGTDWLTDPRFIAGFVFFLSGMFINLQSDHILRRLRKSGEENYKIPGVGLFKYISCPNYLGEIMEWIGWAIATWSIPGLAFAVFTIANLAPRALSNHKWYIDSFSDYPEDRKALIPFIY